MDEELVLKAFRKKMVVEAVIVSGLLALSIGLTTGLIVAIISLATGFFWGFFIAVAAAITITAPVTYAFYRRIFKLSTKKLLLRVDSMGMEQRVITAHEYKSSNSFIAQKLREDTEARVASIDPKEMKFKFPFWPFIVLGVAALAFVLMIILQPVFVARAHNTFNPVLQGHFRYVVNSHVEWDVPLTNDGQAYAGNGFSIRIETVPSAPNAAPVYQNNRVMPQLVTNQLGIPVPVARVDVNNTLLDEEGWPRFPIGEYRIFITTNTSGRLRASSEVSFVFSIVDIISFNGNPWQGEGQYFLDERVTVLNMRASDFTMGNIPWFTDNAPSVPEGVPPVIIDGVRLDFMGWRNVGSFATTPLTLQQIETQVRNGGVNFEAVWSENTVDVRFQFGAIVHPAFFDRVVTTRQTEFRTVDVPSSVTIATVPEGGGEPVDVVRGLVPGELVIHFPASLGGARMWMGWASINNATVPLSTAEIVRLVTEEAQFNFIGVWHNAADRIVERLEELRAEIREAATFSETTNVFPITETLRDALIQEVDRLQDEIVEQIGGRWFLRVIFEDARDAVGEFNEQLGTLMDDFLALRQDIGREVRVFDEYGYFTGDFTRDPLGLTFNYGDRWEEWLGNLRALEGRMLSTYVGMPAMIAGVASVRTAFNAFIDSLPNADITFNFTNANSRLGISNPSDIHFNGAFRPSEDPDTSYRIPDFTLSTLVPIVGGDIVFAEDLFVLAIREVVLELQEEGAVTAFLLAHQSEQEHLDLLVAMFDSTHFSHEILLSIFFDLDEMRAAHAESGAAEPFELPTIDDLRGLFGITGWYSISDPEYILTTEERGGAAGILLYILDRVALSSPSYATLEAFEFHAVWGFEPLVISDSDLDSPEDPDFDLDDLEDDLDSMTPDPDAEEEEDPDVTGPIVDPEPEEGPYIEYPGGRITAENWPEYRENLMQQIIDNPHMSMDERQHMMDFINNGDILFNHVP